MKKRNVCATLAAISLLSISMACKKKTPAPPPPPPPPAAAKPAPAQPAISSFVAEPSTIERGQSATLRWSVSNASDISIDQGVGSVQSSGKREVFPSSTTTYTLTARGEGGSVSARAQVTVTQPPPAPPPKEVETRPSLSSRLAREVRDVYFDFDRYDIRSAPRDPACGSVECRQDAQAVLTANAAALRRILSEFDGAVITIEGHCDERGSAEYNLGLGDRRATAVQDYLATQGVDAARLRIVSYGEERPQCTESNESCWQRNRRAHFTAAGEPAANSGSGMSDTIAEVRQ